MPFLVYAQYPYISEVYLTENLNFQDKIIEFRVILGRRLGPSSPSSPSTTPQLAVGLWLPETYVWNDRRRGKRGLRAYLATQAEQF